MLPGDKDKNRPKNSRLPLTADTLKVESSDDHSGVEAVFVDGNRINSLTNGAASVALKDYAGTEKQVSVYAQDYAGNRSETVKFDNPYYEGTGGNQKKLLLFLRYRFRNSTISVRLVQAQAASSGSTNTSAQAAIPAVQAPAQSGNSRNGSHAGADTGGRNAASGTNENGKAQFPGGTETASSIPEGKTIP